jgi:glycine cleavage system transcriptional repressor
MSLLAVTVLGHDRPGIVADATAALARLGGNLEDSTMTLLRGHFAMLLLVRTAVPPADVRTALDGLTADGRLSVDVRPVPDLDLHAAPRAARRYLLSVHGADRPGIVSAITGVVAGARGNLVDLTTRLTGELYVLLAEVDVPEGVDVAEVDRAVQVAADELGVDVTLRALETDEL